MLLRISFSSLSIGAAMSRVDGGRFFGDVVMKITQVDRYHYCLHFNIDEVAFLEIEAKRNNLTVIEMFEVILEMLFVGGYSILTGKE